MYETKTIDDLNDFEIVQYLQNGLISRATGGSFDDYEYVRARILQRQNLKDKLPKCILTCRTIDQFWAFIKKTEGYQPRREFLWNEFGKLLDELEFAEKSVLQDEVVFDIKYIQERWEKALERKKNDPEGAITLSRTLLEDLFKYMLTKQGIEYNNKNVNMHDLYKKVAKILNFSPEQYQEDVLKQILGGMSGIVTGLSELRNKLGDAHGRASKNMKPLERHSELAVNLAGTMAMFIFRTYRERFGVEPRMGTEDE